MKGVDIVAFLECLDVIILYYAVLYYFFKFYLKSTCINQQSAGAAGL